jgi:putative membrane protein
MMSLSLIGLLAGLFIFVVLLIVLVVLVVWAVRRTGGGVKGAFPGGAAAAQNPKEVLQMRYARGEITREQYQQMLQDLDL